MVHGRIRPPGGRPYAPGAEPVSYWSYGWLISQQTNGRPVTGRSNWGKIDSAVGGGPGWAGRSHGKSFAAFRDLRSGDLCSVVGPGSEDTLTALAADLRAALQ